MKVKKIVFTQIAKKKLQNNLFILGLQQGPKYPETRWGRHMANAEMKKRIGGKDKELKNPEQIVRQRLRLEHIKRKETTNRIKKQANRKKHVKRQKSKSKSARK